MLVDQISNAHSNQVFIWPSHGTHKSPAPYFFETRELRLVKAALAWTEYPLYLNNTVYVNRQLMRRIIDPLYFVGSQCEITNKPIAIFSAVSTAIVCAFSLELEHTD